MPAWSDLTDPTLRRKKERALASSAPVKTAAHDLRHRAVQHGAVQSDVVRSLAAGNHGVPDDAAATAGGGLIGSSTSGDGGGGGGSKNGVAIAEEFRRVAAQHAASYAPGHVPKWLENQAGHQLASGVSPSASAPKLCAADTPFARGFGRRRCSGHRRAAYGARGEGARSASMGDALAPHVVDLCHRTRGRALAAALLARREASRPRRPGEPRSDLRRIALEATSVPIFILRLSPVCTDQCSLFDSLHAPPAPLSHSMRNTGTPARPRSYSLSTLSSILHKRLCPKKAAFGSRGTTRLNFSQSAIASIRHLADHVL